MTFIIDAWYILSLQIYTHNHMVHWHTSFGLDSFEHCIAVAEIIQSKHSLALSGSVCRAPSISNTISI